MYQPTGGEGGELILKAKTNELYREYNVNINTFNDDDNKMNSNDNVFELKFIGKNGDNKGKIYYKIYNNNDINDIKNKVGQPNIKNKLFTKEILYCLSKNNNKYNIKYNNNNNNELYICIEYGAGMVSFNIELNIPGKLSDMDIIKNELKKMTQIITETKRELNAKTDVINTLKTSLNEMKTSLDKKSNEISTLKVVINEIKSDSSAKSREINELKQELNEFKNDSSTKANNIADLQQKLNKTNNKLNVNSDEINALKEELNEIKLSLTDKTNNINELKQQLNTKTNEYNDLKEELNETTTKANKITALQIELNKVKKAVNNSTTKLETILTNNTESKQMDNINASNDDSICPSELNKHPSKWTKNDVKGIMYNNALIIHEYVHMYSYIYIVWFNTLSEYLQRKCGKIIAKELNGQQLMSMTDTDWKTIAIMASEAKFAKKEFNSWLPNTIYKQKLPNNINIDWYNINFKIGQNIKLCHPTYDYQSFDVKVIDTFKNGIKVHYTSYDSNGNLYDETIFKIQYKSRINPNSIK